MRRYLTDQIEASENADEPNKKIIGMLHMAVEGLDNLDFGQPEGIFAAAKS